MYCQSCGTAIGQAMRFCNRCGSSVASDPAEIKRSEKRLDDYLDGLFWITAFGVALTAGGLWILKKAELGEHFLVIFLVLSSTAFLINFAFSLWMAVGIARSSKRPKMLAPTNVDTHELDQKQAAAMLEPPVRSVTENTTRSFEPIYNKRNLD